MKKILIIATSLFVLGGCKKDLSGLNGDPRHPLVVPSYTLFSNAQKNLVDIITTPSVNVNIFRYITQQWTEVTYVDESNYDLGTRNIPATFWSALYKNVLKDLDEAKKLIPTDVTDAGVQKNQLAIADVMSVYTYSILVNTYGDIPYSEALIADNFFPKYDDARGIYDNLLARLDVAIATLNTNVAAGSFGGADLLYGGNVNAWIKFANSLKLRLGLILSDSDPGKAKATVESAVTGGVFTSNSDNAIFKYLPTTPNTNPIWVNLVQSGRSDDVAANTIIDLMNTLNDPRRVAYFTKAPGNVYKGGVPGSGNTYALYSHVGDMIVAPDYPGVLLDYSEVEFALAEARERGMAVGGTPQSHYDNAITASFTSWGVAGVAGYLADPLVKYATAPGDFKQKIGTQKYLALYNRGFDAWVEQRRLNFPTLAAPVTAVSGYPVRFTYPVSEQNLNGTNYAAAASKIPGGDKVESKLFWDK